MVSVNYVSYSVVFVALYLCHTVTYQRRIARVSMRISIRRGLRRILFKRRMYHVRVTLLLRPCGASVTHLYSYGVSLSYVWRIKTYVLRMCDVFVAYEAYVRCTCTCIYGVCTTFHLLCGVSVAYPWCFNTDESKTVLLLRLIENDYHVCHLTNTRNHVKTVYVTG